MMFCGAVERSAVLLTALLWVVLQCSSFVQKQTSITRRPLVTRIGGSADDIGVLIADEKRLKVLCLHGYLSSSKYFRLQLRRLVEEGGDISDFGE